MLFSAYLILCIPDVQPLHAPAQPLLGPSPRPPARFPFVEAARNAASLWMGVGRLARHKESLMGPTSLQLRSDFIGSYVGGPKRLPRDATCFFPKFGRTLLNMLVVVFNSEWLYSGKSQWTLP